MKKSMYWLVSFMLGLSCCLWTGCSDDDKEDPGNGGTPHVPVVATLNLNLVDSIQEGWINAEITTTDDTITSFKRKYGNLGETQSIKEIGYAVAYGNGKVVITYKDDADNKVITYTLNAAGYPASAVLVTNSDNTRALNYAFTYSNKGMLETLNITSGVGVNILKVTYGNTEDWNEYIMFIPNEPVEGEPITFEEIPLTCVASTVKNEYYANLNVMGMLYGQDDALDCALLCGLVPVNPHVLSQITYEGEPMFVYEVTSASGKITTLKYTDNDAEACRIFTFK